MKYIIVKYFYDSGTYKYSIRRFYREEGDEWNWVDEFDDATQFDLPCLPIHYPQANETVFSVDENGKMSEYECW